MSCEDDDDRGGAVRKWCPSKHLIIKIIFRISWYLHISWQLKYWNISIKTWSLNKWCWFWTSQWMMLVYNKQCFNVYACLHVHFMKLKINESFCHNFFLDYSELFTKSRSPACIYLTMEFLPNKKFQWWILFCCLIFTETRNWQILILQSAVGLFAYLFVVEKNINLFPMEM